MVTWDGHMGLSYGMAHMGWSNGVGDIFNQSEVSIYFKTGGYTKCVIYKYQTKFEKHLARKYSQHSHQLAIQFQFV